MAISQATLSDVSSRALRDLTDTEAAWVPIRLRDAFTQIITRIPSVAERLDAGLPTDPFNQLVIQVQAAMVLRVLSNPDGMLEETVDDYTRRLDATISTGSLYLTDQEHELLTGTITGGTRNAFTIQRPPSTTRSSPWAYRGRW